MIWLWIISLLAAASLYWGVRRMYRNRRRLMVGARARHRDLARVAVIAGLCWLPICAAILVRVMPQWQASRRAQAIQEIRAYGGRMADHGGYVDFSNCLITDEHLKPLLRVTEIEELDLRGTMITDASVEYLVSMPRLQKVHLESTAVSWEARKRVDAHTARVESYMASLLAAQAARQKAYEERQKQELADREELEKKGAIKVEEEKYQKAIEEVRGRIGGP